MSTSRLWRALFPTRLPTTCVLGLGNVLMGDDGFGPAVVRAFDDTYSVGPGVTVADLGTPGFDLMPWLADAGHVIIVDTVTGDLPPGTLRLFTKRDLLRHAPPVRVSPHDPGLKETVLALEFAGRAPRAMTLVGIVPERVGLGLELSATARSAVPLAVDAIVAALEGQGTLVARRAVPSAGRPWWLRPAASSAH